jgi:hypothetical protein
MSGSSGGVRFAIVGLAVFAFVFGYGCFGPPGTAACGSATGFAPAILSSIEHCPAAVEKLGSTVHFGVLGLGCSNYASGEEAGEGNAWGDGMPVFGERGSASLSYNLSKGGGVWMPAKMVLTFDDGSMLDVAACTAAFQAERSAEGMVTLLKSQCAEGQALMCESLAVWFDSKGRANDAAEARSKACALGLASSCRGDAGT